MNKELAKNIGLLIVVTMITLIVIEVVLRIAGIGFPIFTMVDEHTGFRLRPYAQGWQRDEGKAYVMMNSDGWRDVERSRKKPEDTMRVAVLGDSFTEARQLPRKQNFVSVAEHALNNCSNIEQNVEVLNFGVSGWGTVQQLLALENYVIEYDPDIVVLAFTTGNDVRNNSKALEENNQKPYAVYQGDLLILDESFRETDFYKSQTSLSRRSALWILNQSRIAQLMYRASKTKQQQEVPEEEGVEAGLDIEIYRSPNSAEWAEAWEVTEELIRLIDETTTSIGAEFILVTLSNGIQVHPEPKVRLSFADAQNIDDLFYPETRLRRIAAKHNVPILTLAQSLQDFAEDRSTFLHGFDGSGKGHWNKTGHREAGLRIADFICSSQ